MGGIVIEPLQPGDVGEAAVLLSRAFVTNPVIVAMFHDQDERTRRAWEGMFRLRLKRMSGQVVVARDGGRVVGVMRLVEWPCCHTSTWQGLKLLPSMFKALKGNTLRVLRFYSIWGEHDPNQPHWHLGPMGVLPERQGHGIGSGLLEHFCEHVDRLRAEAYLETDKPENVRLYERFGFSVTGGVPVYGVPTWFMWRPEQQN